MGNRKLSKILFYGNFSNEKDNNGYNKWKLSFRGTDLRFVALLENTSHWCAIIRDFHLNQTSTRTTLPLMKPTTFFSFSHPVRHTDVNLHNLSIIYTTLSIHFKCGGTIPIHHLVLVSDSRNWNAEQRISLITDKIVPINENCKFSPLPP